MDRAPFRPSFGNRPDRLVGRDSEAAGSLKGLDGPVGHPGRATICLGRRGMGKTALLLEFAELARRRGFVAAKASASPALLAELLEGLARDGARWLPKGRKLTGGSAGALGFSVGLEFDAQEAGPATFRGRLTDISQALDKAGQGLVLLVDEVTANSPQVAELGAAYQELVGEGRNVAIAMAGLPGAVSAVLNDKVLTFLNRAAKFQLSEVPVADVMVHYSQTLKSLGKTIAEADLARAAEATRGYPYLLQLVGYYLLEYVGEDPAVGGAAVDLAIATARKALGDSVFKPALHPLSALDRRFLEAMACDQGPSRMAVLAGRLGVSAASAQQTRARLIAAGVIAAAGRGQVAPALPYLAERLRGEL
jgi:hypothetical protein